MAPIKFANSFDLESLGTPKIIGNHLKIDENINVVAKENQKRLTIYHYVVHILAFIITIPFIFLIVYGRDVPPEYSTIVSMVIGFYFAKSLFNNN